MAPPTPATPVVTTHQVDGHDDGTRPLSAVATEVEEHEPAAEAPGTVDHAAGPAVAPPAVPRAAVLVTGAVVGLAGALLTYLSLRGCEAVAAPSPAAAAPGCCCWS